MTHPAILETATEADDALLKRWRGVLDELCSGHFSITPALAALTVVAESAERAVLLLAHDDLLVALGAFGFAEPSGLALAVATRRLVLPATSAPRLRQVLREGTMRATHFDAGDLPLVLAARVGRPRRPEGLLLPVTRRSPPHAVIYADNGPLHLPIADPETLAAAVADVARAFDGAPAPDLRPACPPRAP